MNHQSGGRVRFKVTSSPRPSPCLVRHAIRPALAGRVQV